MHKLNMCNPPPLPHINILFNHNITICMTDSTPKGKNSRKMLYPPPRKNPTSAVEVSSFRSITKCLIIPIFRRRERLVFSFANHKNVVVKGLEGVCLYARVCL